MTRDQAIKRFADLHNNHQEGWAARWIDAFVELDMLKLEQSLNADQKLATALSLAFSFDTGVKEMNMFREMLNKSGLKVVEK